MTTFSEKETRLRETTTGPVRGYIRDGIAEYRGIPYAEPPVGALRFKRARPHAPWTEVCDAAEFGAASCQVGREGYTGNEDCLFLNVQTPADAKPGDNLPVFVFIHGGGYNTGMISDPLIDGRAFAEDGMIYIAMQYRLNVLGFYDFSTYPGGEAFETNCGLSDIILAMQWIHDNVAAFGGDPARVTIDGESAGGAAVVTLLAVPSVRGMFSQAIAQSGLPNCVFTPEMARRNSDLFLEGMGMTPEQVSELLTMDPEALQKGNDYVARLHQYRNPGIFLPAPVIDDLLPERPIDAIRKGSAEGVRLLIGTNLHEGSMFVRPEATNFPNCWAMVAQMFENNGHLDALLPVIAYYDPEAAALLKSPEDAFSLTEVSEHLVEGIRSGAARIFFNFATDYVFAMPAVKVAEAQRGFTPDVWMYRYEFISEEGMQNGMGASHAFELPSSFACRLPGFADWVFGGDRKAHEALIKEIHGSFSRFAREGDPGPEWERYVGYRSAIRVFDLESRTEVLDRTDMMQVWDDMRFYED